MEDNRAGWGTIALTALPAAVWGSTYAVTQLWLPPDRPLFAATLRALPVGLLMLLWLRRLPRGDWWWRSLVLGSLNIGVFYALLFFSAYRLPSGLGATLVATAPMVTMAVAWILLGDRPGRISLAASVVGLFGVGLLVLQNGLDRPLDPLGLGAGLLAVLLSSCGFVLTKKWTPPVDVVTATSWQLVAGGVVLVPIALVVEGAPPAIDLPAVGALAYLGLIGSGLAYVLWFRGLTILGPTAASIIGLVNPVVGVLLGVILLGETLRSGAPRRHGAHRRERARGPAAGARPSRPRRPPPSPRPDPHLIPPRLPALIPTPIPLEWPRRLTCRRPAEPPRRGGHFRW